MNRLKYGTTVATCVCWSIASLTSTWYGLTRALLAVRWGRHGRSRRHRSYQRSSRRAKVVGTPSIVTNPMPEGEDSGPGELQGQSQAEGGACPGRARDF